DLHGSLRECPTRDKALIAHFVPACRTRNCCVAVNPCLSVPDSAAIWDFRPWEPSAPDAWPQPLAEPAVALAESARPLPTIRPSPRFRTGAIAPRPARTANRN